MAQSREQLCDHRDLVLWHLNQLGLRVIWEKSKLSPCAEKYFLSMELDLVNVMVHLTNEHAQSVLNCLSSSRGYSLTKAPLGTDALAHSWPLALRKYVFPTVILLTQTLCKVREGKEHVLLVVPYWPTRTWFHKLMWIR